MSSRSRALWWSVFAVVWALGVLWAFASPVASGPDEDTHTVKAGAMAAGQFRGEVVDVDVSDAHGPPRQDTHYRLPAWFGDLRAQRCYAFQAAVTPACAPPWSGGGDVDVVSTAGSYPPLFYVAVGWPSRLTEREAAVRAMRAVGAGLCAALVASALVAAVRTGGRAASLGVVLAVPPMAVYLFGIVNPNGLEAAGAVALWAATAAVLAAPDVGRRDLVRVVVALVAVAAARPTGPVLAVGIVAVVVVALASRDRIASLWRRTDARVALGAAAVGLAATTAWMVLVPMPLAGVGQPDLTLSERLRQSWDLLPQRAGQMVGRFGWLDTPLPSALAWTWLAVTALLALVGLWRGSWRLRAALLATVVGLPASAVVIEALQAPRVGLVWQGRYSLAVFAGVPLLAVLAVTRRPFAPRTTAVVAGVVTVGAAGVQVVAFWTAMARYAAGRVDWLAWTRTLSWEPPGGAVALSAAFAVVALGSGALLAWWMASEVDQRTTAGPDGVAAVQRPARGTSPGPP